MSHPTLLVRMLRGCIGAVSASALMAAAVQPAHAIERGPTRLSTATSTMHVETEARVIVKYRADSSLMHAMSATAAAPTSANADVPPQHAQALALRLGVPLTDGRPTGPRSQLIRASGITSADLAAQLSAQSDVEYAVVDTRVRIASIPSDPLFAAGQATTPAAGQWYLRTPGGDGQVASINAEAAWSITTGLSSVVVAVIDTGITSHPDLAGKVLAGYDFISDSTTAGDGNGRDSDPTDVGDGITAAQVSTITNCTTDDVGNSSWHGTQTAGLIGAATNNGVGMASVGWNVMVQPLRVLGKCGGSESDVAAAIRWAAGGTVSGVPANATPAKVINLSLGGTSGVACDAEYQDAVTFAVNAGVVVVAAAGNDGLALGSPANCTGVIAVAGVRQAGTKVGYSDLGPTVTIAAPAGNCVNATGQTCLFPLVTTSNDGALTIGNPVYTDGDVRPSLGTSFSTPLVAGTVALMFSANPSLTPAQIRTALMSTARAFPTSGSAPIQQTDNGPFVPVAACTAPSSVAQGYECYCTTSTCGAGLLDAGGAVAAALATVNPAPTAGISASASTITAGNSVTFSSTSTASGSHTIVSYQWAITAGGSIAAFSTATNSATATVMTAGAGTLTLSLTVTDNAGQTSTTSSTVTVTTASTTPTTPTTPTTTSSGGGGGALGWRWLIGLAAGSLMLWRVRRRA